MIERIPKAVPATDNEKNNNRQSNDETVNKETKRNEQGNNQLQDRWEQYNTCCFFAASCSLTRWSTSSFTVEEADVVEKGGREEKLDKDEDNDDDDEEEEEKEEEEADDDDRDDEDEGETETEALMEEAPRTEEPEEPGTRWEDPEAAKDPEAEDADSVSDAACCNCYHWNVTTWQHAHMSMSMNMNTKRLVTFFIAWIRSNNFKTRSRATRSIFVWFVWSKIQK